MECVKVTDEWLYLYMPVVDVAIIEGLEKQIDISNEFSRKFDRKMKHLIQREAHPWWGLASSIVKRAAIFLICNISVAFLFTMSVEAYRVKFFETIKTLWEDSILYSYFTDSTTGEIQNSEPTYIPEGYSEVERIENDIALIVIYENDAGEEIVWEQKMVVDGGNLVLDSEYDTQEMREINGAIATISYYSDGYATAYYEYGNYVYFLTADRLEMEDIFKIIESMNY